MNKQEILCEMRRLYEYYKQQGERIYAMSFIDRKNALLYESHMGQVMGYSKAIWLVEQLDEPRGGK